MGDEQKVQVPLEKNPAGDSQNDGNPVHQVVPPPQTQHSPQDQQHQQQQQQQQATDGKDKHAGDSAAADSQRQSQTAGAGDPVKLTADGSHGDAAKEVEVEGFQHLENTGKSASVKSVLVSY